MDLPAAYLSGDVPAACVEIAARDHRLPPLLLLAIMRAENGRAGKSSKNKDGTRDYGPMQINSRWKSDLSKYGINLKQLRNDGCINVYAGAWILRQCLNRYESNDYWRGVGCYHSVTRYPIDRNGWYAAKVWSYYDQYRAAENQKP